MGAAAILALGRLVWLGLEGFPIPATNPNRYRPISSRYRNDKIDGPGNVSLLAGFPDDIPAHAINVEFLYTTPPGDIDLELRCTLPPNEVAAIASTAARTAKVTFNGPDWVDFSKQMEIPPVFSLGHGPTISELPSSFKVYVFGVGHIRDSSGTGWWIEQSGVAVDTTHNVVLWWIGGMATDQRPTTTPSTGP